MKIKKNDTINLNIEDVTLEGVGVGRHNGVAVFVPGVAVGDVLKVKIIKVKSSYLVGKTEEILVPSDDRIALDCGSANACGGCAFRHISYQAELKIKQKHVADCLERIGGFKGIEIQPIVGAKNILNYRNKVQIPLSYDTNGEVISGFYANHSHRIVPCRECLLQPKIFDEIIDYIKKFIKGHEISVYNENTKKGLVRHIYLRSAQNTSQIMLCLVINGEKLPYADEFVDAITKKFKQIKSIFINVNKKDTNVILGDKFKKIFGDDYIADTLCDKKFVISPDSFYQVNHDQTEILYGLAGKYLTPKDSDNLLDLYCGIGTIGLTMAEKVGKLFGVEIVESAVKNARQNALLGGNDNAKFFCDDSGDITKKKVLSEQNLDIVIVDPPRKGCSDELIDNLLKISPQKILYISCNPATLAKNLKQICESGKYSVSVVAPVDMFPRTSHVETIALLVAKNIQ